MSATTEARRRRRRRPVATTPRADDPRVIRSRALVVDAARSLFLRHGYAGTTMEDIARQAGLTKRTLYNNYGGKDALFTQIIADVFAFAESFARGLHEEFAVRVNASNIRGAFDDLACRLALGILRPDVIALRRLLIGESRSFPGLGAEYFARAPGQVLDALASEFTSLRARRLLRMENPRRAATHFAYLVAGEPLDRALLLETLPSKVEIIDAAKDGARTFMARYGVGAARNA